MLTCRGGVHWASLRRRAATELAARTCCSASSSQCWRSTVSDASPGAMGALAATCCGSAGGAGLAACSPGWAPKGFSESSHDIALKAPWRVRLGKVRDGHWGREEGGEDAPPEALTVRMSAMNVERAPFAQSLAMC